MNASMNNITDKGIFKLISETANSLGIRAYVVGGYVRDFILGRANNKIDIVVEGDGIEFGKAIAERCHSKTSCFKNFGVCLLKYHGDEIGFQGARKEIFSANSKKPTFEPGTIGDDLRRRAFTINSIAFSLNSTDFGILIDPYGGLKDISQGIIRAHEKAEELFQRDPLAMLIAIRLSVQLSSSQLSFRIQGPCMDAIRKSVNAINYLSKERVVEELNKMLLCDIPGDAFYLLDQVGLLSIIIPELTRTKGVETIAGHSYEDGFEHSLKVLDNIATLELSTVSDVTNSLSIKAGEPNLWLRWTALLHDIGKPTSKRFVEGRGWTFYGYEVVGARMIPEIFKSLKMPLNEKMKYVQRLIQLQTRPKNLLDTSASDSGFRRLLFDAGDDIWDLLLLCEANITTRNKTKAAQERASIYSIRQKLSEVQEKDAIRNFKNPISANYIMDLYGIEPCDTLSVLKDIIKNAILKGEIANTFEEADAFLRQKAAEMGLTIKGTEENPDSDIEEQLPDEDPSNGGTDTFIEEQPEIGETTDEIGTPACIEEEHSSDETVKESLEEIVRVFTECGITKLYYFTGSEDLDDINEKHAIVKDRIVLYTRDSNIDRKDNNIALDIDLNVLSLPGVMISQDVLLSRGLSLGAAISEIKILNLGEESLSRVDSESNEWAPLKHAVIIVPGCIPIEMISNFDSMFDEYSSILPF